MHTEETERAIRIYPDKWRLLKGLRFYRLWVPRPVVVVNDGGIAYHESLLPPFFTWRLAITWAEIAAIYVQELTRQGTKNNRLLAIVPKDIEAFFEQRPRLLKTGPLLVLMTVTGTPFMIREATIAPCSVDALLAQIRVQFQPELEAHSIELSDEQHIVLPDRSMPGRGAHRKRPPQELSIDRGAFRQWLEQQEGPLVGMGRVDVFQWLRDAHAVNEPARDETPLARYLRDTCGLAVYIASPGVFSAQMDNPEMSRLPPWAQAFEERVQPAPETTVTKGEALAALDAV